MIARMKAFILPMLAAILLALFPPAPLSAAAETQRYAVAPTEDVWFYAGEREEDRLFLLPCTYYVRVLEEGETYSAVEYAADAAPYKKLLGYCRTDLLLFVDFIPARPYLVREVTLTYRLPDAGSLGSEEFSAMQRTFAYYGERTERGQRYYYVYDGETFGYVPADEPLAYERNDDYLQAVSGETEQNPAPETENASPNGVQIAVICVVCAAAVVVAVLVLRGKKPPQSDPDV